MKNLDNLPTELRSKVHAALSAKDDEAIENAMVELALGIQESVVSEARSMMKNNINDYNVMMQRGQSQLTTEERAYYNAVKEKRGFTDLEITMPTTIFERVFDDLDKNHPLLSEINFENTTGVMKWLTRKEGKHVAAWGPLNSDITKELVAGFQEIDAVLCKLTAFIPISKDMLDLGAVWIDRYVRIILSESIAAGLEDAIIAGDGKDKPIGMLMNLKGAVTEGVYSKKEKTPLLNLEADTLGKQIMSPLTKDGTRKVPRVMMIVNPLDYWEKIFGLTTKLTDDGRYVTGILPIPHKIIESEACPKGTMICGLAKDYFMGIAAASKIEYSDEVKFLEDQRVYITKQHANGRPKDNESFLVFDISSMGETARVAKGRKSASNKDDEIKEEKA